MTPTSPKAVRRGGSSRPPPLSPNPYDESATTSKTNTPAPARSPPSASPTSSRPGTSSWTCTTVTPASIPTLPERPPGPRRRRRRRPATGTISDRRTTPHHHRHHDLVLDTLEKRGLIQRMPHPDDRRKLLIDITPAAQAILDELLPSLHAREHQSHLHRALHQGTTRTPPTRRQSPTRRPPRTNNTGATRRHPTTTATPQPQHNDPQQRRTLNRPERHPLWVGAPGT